MRLNFTQKFHFNRVVSCPTNDHNQSYHSKMDKRRRETLKIASNQTRNKTHNVAHHTKRKPPPIELHTTTINKRKNKRTKPNTKKHTKQKRRTLAKFAIPKRKHSPQWLRMSLRIKNISTKNFECNNHAKPSLQQSVNTTSNNILNGLSAKPVLAGEKLVATYSISM